MYMYRINIACAILIVLTIYKQIHNIQLNSYNLDQQLIWYKKNASSFVAYLILFISSIFYYVLNFFPALFFLIISLLIILIENIPHKQKKKLVFTARIIRLTVFSVILFLPFIIINFIYANRNTLVLLILVTSLSPYIVFLAYLILLPFENALRRKYMNEAKKIIDERITDHLNLHTIGITGSFGKTSVKYYLNSILKYKYSVCMTPESYNTPMGAVLTIKNNLKNINDIFICEMGARRIGDIKEICDIVHPISCIITDVGNMHLDTFRSIDNILKTKFELVDFVYNNINKSGYILLNGDNNLIRERSKLYINNRQIFFYGLNDDNDFYAKDIIYNNKGTKFKFVANVPNVKTLNDCGQIEKMEFEVETKLLGKYSVMNLVAAISFSILLNVDKTDIINAIRKLESVPHRLQIIPYDANNIIIDDAYNSNPNGARNAVDVLASFDDYIKIIITPGMVELNDKQDLENESFAEYASKKVDYAIVVGNTNKVSLDNGFKKFLDSDKIVNIEKVEAAISYARNNIEGKKVILLENDLSDNY